MMRDRNKILRLLTSDWCAPGEQLVFLVGGGVRTGWLGATLGNARHVPHLPDGDDGVPAPWPSVNPGLSAGDFLADEWVHDPAVWGWCHGDDPNRAASRCGTALNRGKHFSWFVGTDRRLAVIVETDARAAALAEQQPAAAEEPSGFLGGVFGKPKSKDAGADSIATWWEVPIGQVADVSPAELGRCPIPVEFFRIHFVDGSIFEFRLLDAAQLVDTVRPHLR